MPLGGVNIGANAVYALLMQAGATREEARLLTAIAGAESSYYTRAYNPSGASGLFQHMPQFWENRSRQAGFAGADIYDINANVGVALWLFRTGGPRHWEAYTLGMHNRFFSAADEAATAYDNGYRYGMNEMDDKRMQQGMPPLDRPPADAPGGVGPDGGGAPPGPGPLWIPTGGEVYNVDGVRYVVYKVGDTAIYYQTSTLGGGQTISGSAWQSMAVGGRWVDGGNAEAVFSDPEFQDELSLGPSTTFNEIWEKVLRETFMWGNEEALSDPTIVHALLEYMADPTMDPDYFESLIRDSDYWKAHTDRQRVWNDLSPAEQEQQTKDMAAQLAVQWRAYTGQHLDLSGDIAADHPELWEWAQKVASGGATSYMAVAEWIMPAALEDPESTYSRLLRDEERARGSFEVDIETQAAAVVDLYERYGLQIDFETAKSMGEQLSMNKLSIAELEERVMDMSLAMYPTKPREIDVATYSSPYRMAMAKTLEMSDPGMFDDLVQQAMTEGTSLADFGRMLRRDDRWRKTDNARAEYNQRFSEIGKIFGF